jgi:hypothetical protein
MVSGRSESVVRHVRNPRIHGGQAAVIPFVDYIVMSKNRATVSSCAHMYRSRIDSVFRKPIAGATFFDKVQKKIQEIKVEMIAKNLTDPSSSCFHYGQYVPTFAFPLQRPVVTRVTHYLGENIFAIRGHLCSKCLTIKPTIYVYGSAAKANLSCISYPIDKECVTKHNMSSSERNEYLKHNTTNGFPTIVREWVRTLWSSNLSMRITALKVPSPRFRPNITNNIHNTGVAADMLGNPKNQFNRSTSKSSITISLTFSNGRNDPSPLTVGRKEITLFYDSSDFFDLSRWPELQPYPHGPSGGNSLRRDSNENRSVIKRAIESSEIVINTEHEMLEFLTYTKFGTFGFFRTSSIDPSSNSPSSGNSGPAYFLLLTPSEFSVNGKFCASLIQNPLPRPFLESWGLSST